ncbi:hypothetical protein [Clostridium tarantellae]|uniref:Uncharacterized protein n=1 Tax=Clostridium tarantellae TaxID=39493 RepID=A0A6I1MXB9_9CLOT|nr:hypothetical protein [Clostridium tarantellae]MPQ44799.1 hypothetical protein [Clostridium tarantellae]
MIKVKKSCDGFKNFTGEKFTKKEFLDFCNKTSERCVKENRDVTTSSYIDKVSKYTSLEHILNLKTYLQRRFYYNKDSKLFKKLSVSIDSFKRKEIDEIYDKYLLQKLDKRFCENIYQRACGEWNEGWGEYGDTKLWNVFGSYVFNDINLDAISENVKEAFMKKAKREMIKKYIEFKVSKGIIISPKEDNNQFIEELIKEIEDRFLRGWYGYVLKDEMKKIVTENMHLKNIAHAIKCVDEEKNKSDEFLEYFIKHEVEFRKEYRKIKEYQLLIEWWENVSINMLDILELNERCIRLSGIVKGEKIPAIQIYKSDIYEDINRLIINKIMKLAKEKRTEAIDLFIQNKLVGQSLLKFKYFTATEQKIIGAKLGLNTKRYNSSIVKLRDDIVQKIKK